MKKVVLKLEFVDEKNKQKVMRKVSGLSGLESISFDQKDKKLIVTGDIDPVALVSKVKKICYSTDIVSVGPAKEPEKKKEEPKKEAKKEEPKKDDKNKDEAAKAFPVYHYPPHYYYHQQYQQASLAPPPPSYYHRSVEEDPNGCVIC